MRPKYTCRAIPEAEADAFLEDEHRQGALRKKSNTKNLGLFLDLELHGVLQVGLPRTAAMHSKYTSEIYRLAFKKGIRVPGGASKLIKNYIRLFSPSDFFTYQDTSGENTLVYFHSGMTLVKDGLKSTKEYLVAPDKTLETGSRKEVLGMAYATRYGPDRILGTKLGEVLKKDGTRKSNRDIFVEELGWHVETTTGDSIWEWFNPNVTFYTYKITASDSEKYYFGVSHVKKANATERDCLGDGYYGSGGKSGKYANWKSSHKNTLKKEVLEVFSRKAEAYAAESKLVGDLYKNDKNCLNSTAGGKLQPYVAKVLEIKRCHIHGDSKHNGGSCLKCVSARSRSMDLCEHHGETIFVAGKCLRCVSISHKKDKKCVTHGFTRFQGDSCYKCMSESKVGFCVIHGETKHYGGKCMACYNSENITIKACGTHGLVKHIGNKCYVCSSNKSVRETECPVHGLTKHRGEKCFKCRAGGASRVEMDCPKHGLSKHIGDVCMKCVHQKNVQLKDCSIHGSSKHRGDSCFKCNAAKRAEKKSNLDSE